MLVSVVMVGLVVVVIVTMALPWVHVESQVEEPVPNRSPEGAEATRSLAAAQGLAGLESRGDEVRSGVPAQATQDVWGIDPCGQPTGAGIAVPLARDPSPPRMYHFAGLVDAQLLEPGTVPRPGSYHAKLCGTLAGTPASLGGACGANGGRRGRGALLAGGRDHFAIADAQWTGGAGTVREMRGRIGWAGRGKRPALEYGFFRIVVVLPLDGRCQRALSVSGAGMAAWLPAT